MKPPKRKFKVPKGGTINPALDKYNNVVLFPNLLKKANEILSAAGVPKIVEEASDETAFLLANPANRAMLKHSIEQDKKGESISWFASASQ